MLLSELIDQLAKGERSPEKILAGLQPPGDRLTLMNCAAVRSFDRELAATVLLVDGGPDFDALVTRADIESVPRRAGVFRVRSSARSAHWREWWSDAPSVPNNVLPPQLRILLERLVDYHFTHDQPIDLLAQCALVDPDRAARLFADLYDLADGSFDLAACQDLIDVLSEPARISLLSPRLTELRTQNQAYLRARGLWSAEWFSSGRFLEPTGVLRAYEDLLDPQGPRALNLHAPGGRGKSIQLRWLISRRLVPKAGLGGMAGGQVPCAKVDFDFVDPVIATRYPWIVLLDIAAQINDQLPNPPFSALLEENGWATPLLQRSPSDPERITAASGRVRGQGDRIGQQVIKKFGGILAEQLGQRPVVFVFDTLEEIHLRPQGDLAALLELVGDLLNVVPGLRLIFSGRYPIRDILGDVSEALPAVAELELMPFTAAEADHYLSRLRAIERPAIRQALVSKANGDPFLLSLLADVVQERPQLSLEEIERYPADVIYLIRRVVQRIQEPGVRWLLRYGVVPRRLTLAFVRDVMQPYLLDAMSGRLSHDEPELDDLPEQAEGTAQHFPTDVIDDNSVLSVDALWAELLRYAGSTSWVSEVPGSQGTLRFRAEVVNPMREIIRKQPVYRELHESAVRHYQAKAQAEPANWETWMREVIYHRFQLDGAAAVDYWRAAMDTAGEAAPARREAIAAELLEPDYVDEQGVPLPGIDNRPIVDPRTLVEARFERCLALVGLARQQDVSPDDPLWSQAEKGLAAALDAERALGHSVIGNAGLAYVRGAFALKAGDLERAEQTVRDALPTADGAERVRLELLLGDVEFARGDRAAAATYRRAMATAGSADWGSAIRRRIMVAEAAVDSLAEAIDAYHQAAEVASTGRERAELSVYGAAIELRCGWATRAGTTAEGAIGEAGASATRLCVASALAELDPTRAAELASRPAAWPGRVSSTGATATREAAEASEAVGVARSALMDHVEASAAFDTARSLWHSLGNLAAVARCSAASAALEMRQVGDLNVAAHHLREAETVEVTEGGDEWLDSRLLRAELLARQDENDAAAASVGDTLEALQRDGSPPRRLIRAAVAALTHGEPDRYSLVLDGLLRQCALVTPISARLVLLRGLSDVERLPGRACQERLESLRRLVGPAFDAQLSVSDIAVLRLTIAEVERLAGNPEAALAQLGLARDGLSRQRSPFWLRPWSQSLDRLGSLAQPVADIEVERFVTELSPHPLLCAAFLIERAEARIAAGATGAVPLLDDAARRLVQVPGRETQWEIRLARARATCVGDDEAAELRSTSTLAARGLGRPVTGGSSTAGPAGDPMSELAGRRVRVLLSRDPRGRLDVRATVPGSPPISLHERAEVPYVSGKGRRDTESMASWWLEDRQQTDSRFAGLLRSTLEATQAAGVPVELRLESRDNLVHTYPWELWSAHDVGLGAQPGVIGVSRVLDADAAARDETAFLQAGLGQLMDRRVLVDAEFGPQLRASLREFQQLSGLIADGVVRDEVLERLQRDLAVRSPGSGRPPLVVLVQPSTERQVYGDRGTASMGVDIERSYEYAGFRVQRLETLDVGELRKVVERATSEGDTPTVLHLSGGLRELGGGIALTFLAGEWSQEAQGGWRTSDEFSVTAIGFVLDAVPREASRPLVVLDIDSPHGAIESAAQLFMRNAFAADLFALGHSPAIIATGLSTDSTHNLYDELVQSLGAGESVLETTSRLQHVPSWGFNDIGPSATALFTHLPWLRPSLR